MSNLPFAYDEHAQASEAVRLAGELIRSASTADRQAVAAYGAFADRNLAAPRPITVAFFRALINVRLDSYQQLATEFDGLPHRLDAFEQMIAVNVYRFEVFQAVHRD